MTPEAMKAVADHAHQREADARKALEAAQLGVKGVQEVCPHDWKDEGYDPRGGGTQHETCRICRLKRHT